MMEKLIEALEIHDGAIKLERARWQERLHTLFPLAGDREYPTDHDQAFHDGQCDILERLELIMEEMAAE